MANLERGAWIEELSLANRRPPELYSSGDDVSGSPHAGALRVAFTELGLAAILCVADVPTIGFLLVDEDAEQQVDRVHHALWNQGLMGLLVVIQPDTVRAYSLARLPAHPASGETTDRRLVQTFSRLADALRVRDIVLSVESGRWWLDHSHHYGRDERIDRVLLSNLMASYSALKGLGLEPSSAQAILMQVMFIAYLEDRGIVTEAYFRKATNRRHGKLIDILKTQDVVALGLLFALLKQHFNGGLFIAPCSFDTEEHAPALTREQMSVLARFRSGTEDMERRQLRFWGYNFRFIPVELLSSVYDRFLGEDEAERRADGAYYTPMFLADLVVSQAWDAMTNDERSGAVISDPACGSGIFLVRMFQRIVEHQRLEKSCSLDWDGLLAAVGRVRGADINPSALRVAAFSLYIALLAGCGNKPVRAPFPPRSAA